MTVSPARRSTPGVTLCGSTSRRRSPRSPAPGPPAAAGPGWRCRPAPARRWSGWRPIRDRVAAGAVGKAVVLGPNTAIQGQWERSAARARPRRRAPTARSRTRLTALTYQALAVFDPDAEVDDDGVPRSRR